MTARRKSRRRKSNRGGVIFLILIVIVAAIAFFTNPDESAHKEAMRLRTSTVMTEIVAEQNNPVITTAWGLTGNRLLNEFVNVYVTKDNYHLFSLTKVNWDGQSYSVGVGVFGNVFITRHLDRNLVQPIMDDARNQIINSVPPFLRVIFQ